MKVFIKSIPRETVSKVSEFRNIGSRGEKGRKMNKTKLSDKCKDGIQALYSSKIGGLKTGLYKTTTNADGETISLQKWAEEKWNQSPGFLGNKSFRKGNSMNPEDMTYFQKRVWKLNDGTTVLDLDKLDDWCFYQVAMESKYVASSEKEWKQHKWPKATHYIALENESEELKYKKNHKKSLAISKLHNEDMTLSWKRKFVVILGVSSARNTLTEETAVNALFDGIQDNKTTSTGKDFVDRFMEIYKKFETPEGRERLESEYLLNELIDYNIVFEKAGTYNWKSKALDIGFTKEESVDYLIHPKKQAQVEDLIKELKLKKGEIL